MPRGSSGGVAPTPCTARPHISSEPGPWGLPKLTPTESLPGGSPLTQPIPARSARSLLSASAGPSGSLGAGSRCQVYLRFQAHGSQDKPFHPP